MPYTNYDVHDFVLDENFKRWVLSPNAESSAFWNAWLRENPSKLDTIKEARQIILMMRFKKDQPSQDDFQEVWQAIQSNMDASIPSDQTKIIKLHQSEVIEKPKSKYYRIAATIAFLCISSLIIFLYLNNYRQITISTTNAEMRTVVLPDESVVSLNANSELRYNKNWNTDQREIWLTGEAFFSVTHQANHSPFIVHTQHIDINVLGTEFNVDERADRTQVMLTSGKVHVKYKKKDLSEDSIDMVPGELLAYSHQKKEVSKKTSKAELETSWRSNKLVYEDAPISEVIYDMERQFGLSFHFENEAILANRFTGIIPANSADAFLITIENTFEVKLRRKGNTITVSSK
ncbi:FecR domain-containing protein [Porifericola rhodea]|uniref:FecR family protein n=1 Tax=Porifericola rhodea TaxID=930972 RepID=UPI002664F207|nr:FecR domain-containing protein [Porifericola rhodea]WKN30857.1 FecR domain-containing protein [Porifericola rhodea]